MGFNGCYECGKDLPEGQKSKFCKKTACRTRFNSRRFEKLPAGRRATIGAAAEMLVAADLLTRDKDVLRSLNPHGGFDLAFLADNRPLKIEVKTGHLCENKVLFADTGYGPDRRRGRQESDKSRTNRFDILAVALLGQKEVIYNPEPENWGKEKCKLGWRQRTMAYTGACRRVKRCEVRDGKLLHVELEDDGMVLEMTLEHFPELGQASPDVVSGIVVRNGYWMRWPALDFEINVTDFLRAEQGKAEGHVREGGGNSQEVLRASSGRYLGKDAA